MTVFEDRLWHDLRIDHAHHLDSAASPGVERAGEPVHARPRAHVVLLVLVALAILGLLASVAVSAGLQVGGDGRDGRGFLPQLVRPDSDGLARREPAPPGPG